MQPYLETAIQWLHDSLRCQLRAQRESDTATSPADWVNVCWEVGHSLAMMQAHGIPVQPVIDAVSERLVGEFGSEGDLSPYGLRSMRQFFLDYFERPQLHAKLRTVPWDCHKLILSLCRDPMQQEYYLDLCRAEGLTVESLAKALKERRYEVSSASVRVVPPKAPSKGSTRLARKS